MQLKLEKREVKSIIFTPQHKIEGNVHVFQKGKLADFINSPLGGDFIAVTNVKVYSAEEEDKLLFESDFMNVQKKYIILIFPLEKEQYG